MLGFTARRAAFELASIRAAHEFLAHRAANATLRLADTHLGEPSSEAPLSLAFLHPAGAAAPVQHVRHVTQHVQHLHLLQQFIHRLTLRVEQHGRSPRASRSHAPARLTMLRERLVETMRSMREGVIRRDIERLIGDRFAERDVERVLHERLAGRHIERLMQIRFAKRITERLTQARFDRQNNERLMRVHFGGQNTERLTQIRVERLNTERLMQVRFDRQNAERLMQVRFDRHNTERLTQLSLGTPNVASVTHDRFVQRTVERLTRDRFTRLEFERLAHVRRTARDFERQLFDRPNALRTAVMTLHTAVAPLFADTSTTVLQRYGASQPVAATLALRHAPQAQAGEIKREIERIERTVQTKVVREILHQGHQQQHIRTAVSDALLSPKLVQALARQIHTTLEQRANVERYRKGAR